MTSSLKGITVALARVRKELPPPGKVIRSKTTEARQRAKERLRRELRELSEFQ